LDGKRKEALKQPRMGKPITGKDGVLAPLIKRIVESALKGVAHFPHKYVEFYSNLNR